MVVRRARGHGARLACLALGAGLALACSSAPASSRPAAPAAPPVAPAAPPAGAPGAPAAVAPAPAAPVAPPAPPKPVRIAFQGQTLQQLPVQLAEDAGVMTEEGLQLEMIHMQSATVTTAALLNNEIDFLSGLGTAVRASLQGIPLKAVVAGERTTAYTLAARPEFRTVADLRGGKVGTSSLGGSDFRVLGDLLRRHGLEPQENVAVIAVGGTTARFTALTNGAIDAGLLSPPASILAEKQGLRSLAGPSDLIPYPSGGLVTSDQKLTAERAFVKSTIRAYVRGLQLIHTSRDAAVAAIRDILEIDPETAQATYEFALGTLSRDGTTPDEAQRLLVEVEAASLELTQTPPPTIGFDFTLVEEVRRELGLAGAR